jgi:hypothetical protein
MRGEGRVRDNGIMLERGVFPEENTADEHYPLNRTRKGSYLAPNGLVIVIEDLDQRLDQHLDVAQRLDPKGARE